MSQPKVVELNATSKKASAQPPILKTMRQRAAKQLSKLLAGLFNNADDALFEMADRSRSDADQHLYFESMRELRLQRENITRAFAKEFNNGFLHAMQPAESEPESEEPDFENVSMIENDDLEISVAVAGIVSKVTSQHSLPVMQLTRRIDHLVKETEITEKTNPMGPEQLSQAFVSAISCAELDIKVRIILLKLFERFVMERLAGVYSDANQMLAEAGVLTDLKNIMRTNRDSSTTRRDARQIPEETLAPEQGRSTTSFQIVQDLLAARRGSAPAATGGMASQRGSTGTVHASLSSDDVVAALNAAQNELTAPIDLETAPRLLDLRHLVISNSAQSGSAQLAQAEDDVVNFVGMLFDYILNDRNLAIPMKALIGRLQLPIVKLAILDRTFFEKTSHPARQLLNQLSSAGIGWSSAKELKRDALYNMVESVVLRVMNGFSDNAGIFSELLDEMRAFVNKDDQKREQVEQRVKDNEKGRARTINAKQTVQQLINQKASGMRLPVEVGRFLSDTWSKVLVYTWVKDGQRSPSWHARTETLDQLLWCLQPLDNLEDMDKRDAMLAELSTSLKAGMAVIQLPEIDIERRAQELESSLNSISANDRAYVEEDAPAPVDDSFEPMDEIVLTLPGEQLDHDTTVDVAPQFIERVGKLREGGWVEITQPSGEVLRCKLSTIIEPGGRYIFVNRRGMKVAERSRRGLAVELKRETLTILAESQVFDRALQAVIGNLRQMHRGSATT